MRKPNPQTAHQELIAWFFCNAGVFAAGFAVCAFFTGTEWLALSTACVGALLFWTGWEIERAVNEPEDQ